jgi:hypothetical protein
VGPRHSARIVQRSHTRPPQLAKPRCRRGSWSPPGGPYARSLSTQAPVLPRIRKAPAFGFRGHRFRLNEPRPDTRLAGHTRLLTSTETSPLAHPPRPRPRAPRRPRPAPPAASPLTPVARATTAPLTTRARAPPGRHPPAKHSRPRPGPPTYWPCGPPAQFYWPRGPRGQYRPVDPHPVRFTLVAPVTSVCFAYAVTTLGVM